MPGSFTREVESINEKIDTQFGRIDGINPHFRVTWADDEFEYRKSEYTPEGIELTIPQIQYMPKYVLNYRHKYILEKVIPLAGINRSELVGKLSYEPVWTFRLNQCPRLDAVQFLIDLILTQAAKAVGAMHYSKYNSELWKEEEREEKKKEFDSVTAELFADETDLTDALAGGSGVSLGNRDMEIK